MKKLLATLLATTMAVSAIGGLVACGEKEPEKVAATNVSLTNVYGQTVSSVEIAPDGNLGVLAKLTPANATSEVKWAVSGTNNITVKPGGVNNTQVFLTCTDYTPGETVKLSATVDGKKAEISVTIKDWTRFMLVGTPNGWNAEDDSGDWLFTQDATDKHKWTIEVSLDSAAQVKVVAAAENDAGKIVGKGWNGGYNLGINQNNPDEPAEGETDTPEQAAARKKQAIDGTSGTLNIHHDGGSGNIMLGTGTPGKYRLTLQTRQGGAFESLTYERVGD